MVPDGRGKSWTSGWNEESSAVFACVCGGASDRWRLSQRHNKRWLNHEFLPGGKEKEPAGQITRRLSPYRLSADVSCPKSQFWPLPESFGIARKLTDEFPFSFMKCIKAEFEKVAISDAVGGS